MNPTFTLALGALLVWLGATGRAEKIWKAIKGGK